MRRLVLLAAPLFLAPLAACGKDAPEKAPPATVGPAADGTYTISHVLIGVSNPRLPNVQRDKNEARNMAESIIRQLAAGASFDELADKYSDDRDPSGKTNRTAGQPTGTYVFTARDSLATGFRKAMMELAVGETTKEPVETEFGYHVMRRIK
jgi:foldase protein PrsA